MDDLNDSTFLLFDLISRLNNLRYCNKFYSFDYYGLEADVLAKNHRKKTKSCLLLPATRES